MCDLSEGFRLCTCAGDGPFDWTLARRDRTLPEQVLRGMWAAPRWDDDDRLRKLFLLDHLNGDAPFDVPWEAQVDDLFTATLKGKALVFRFDGDAWVEDLGSPFASWWRQMVEQRRGTVVLPPDAVPDALLERAEGEPAGGAVLRDWILAEGHPTLAAWILAREAGAPFEREEQISLRLRQRLAKVLPNAD